MSAVSAFFSRAPWGAVVFADQGWQPRWIFALSRKRLLAKKRVNPFFFSFFAGLSEQKGV
ncbi:MAG: hypothetical protein HFE80_01865 [Clostridiaceae bacterium]|nr:hypothetical protein [Clostridiaceae bacterium]